MLPGQECATSQNAPETLTEMPAPRAPCSAQVVDAFFLQIAAARSFVLIQCVIGSVIERYLATNAVVCSLIYMCGLGFHTLIIEDSSIWILLCSILRLENV